MNQHPSTLGDEDLLHLLARGHLEVDLHTCEVKFLDKVQSPGDTGSYKKRPRIEIHYRGKRRSILRSRLVYMAGTRQMIPSDHQVHHLDEDNTNDAFDNLICLSVADHTKLHRFLLFQEEETPF